MKQHLLFFAGLMLAGFISFAQANLVIFSEDGDAFYAYINGVRQNDQPETNVKITGLSGNTSLRIEFDDKTLPQLKQAMSLESGFEHTARIKRDAKKQLKLRYFGQTPLSNSQTQGLSTVPYHTAENPYNTADNSTQPYDNNNTISNNNTSVSTATYNSAGNGAVNISMPGMNVNMTPAGTNVNTTTSTTVTNSSYSSSSTTYNNSSYNNTNNTNNNYHNGHHANNNNQQPVTATNGCRGAMPDASFAKLKQTVESKPFSDTKLSTAKVATKNGCLSTSQVKEICKLFSMDDDKLAYAKYAYEFCVDKANYYQVSEVFSFSTTTDEFNRFLEQ